MNTASQPSTTCLKVSDTESNSNTDASPTVASDENNNVQYQQFQHEIISLLNVNNTASVVTPNSQSPSPSLSSSSLNTNHPMSMSSANSATVLSTLTSSSSHEDASLSSTNTSLTDASSSSINSTSVDANSKPTEEAESATGPASQATPKRLHVSNIPFRFRDPDLRAMFGVRVLLQKT